MDNNWEYNIEGRYLILRFDLLGEPSTLTGCKRGDRVRVAATNNLVVVATGMPSEANMILTANLSRRGTAEELQRLHRVRQAEEAERLRGYV